ncbi:hypothetical protein [Brevibacillus dissolubilis]|uniref:hypothetical protein n=1 Tax=Brevibacillus dissolubilis TaxID=1844116 RepID=UPI001116F930|nr:hypothetical protein [Brevibacillus dissolubilis]
MSNYIATLLALLLLFFPVGAYTQIHTGNQVKQAAFHLLAESVKHVEVQGANSQEEAERLVRAFVDRTIQQNSMNLDPSKLVIQAEKLTEIGWRDGVFRITFIYPKPVLVSFLQDNETFSFDMLGTIEPHQFDERRE